MSEQQATDAPIRVCALVVLDEAGRLLTVRKRGTRLFMFPGGKPEPGETPEQTTVREAAEELGVRLDTAALTDHGTVVSRAANEPGRVLVARVLEHPWVPGTRASAEIAELRWTDLRALDEEDHDLAPLTVEVARRLRSQRPCPAVVAARGPAPAPDRMSPVPDRSVT